MIKQTLNIIPGQGKKRLKMTEAKCGAEATTNESFGSWKERALKAEAQAESIAQVADAGIAASHETGNFDKWKKR